MHLASPYVMGHRGRTFVIAIPGEVGYAQQGRSGLGSAPGLPTRRADAHLVPIIHQDHVQAPCLCTGKA